jgi:hypothetical protein
MRPQPGSTGGASGTLNPSRDKAVVLSEEGIILA